LLRKKPGFAGLRAESAPAPAYAVAAPHPSNPLRNKHLRLAGGEWNPGVEFCAAKLQKQIRNADLPPIPCTRLALAVVSKHGVLRNKTPEVIAALRQLLNPLRGGTPFGATVYTHLLAMSQPVNMF
jgi:hypothetical protein